MQINPLNQLYKDFLTILDEAVIKFSSKADSQDTIDIRRDADRYITAYMGEDTFETYYKYDIPVIMEVMGLKNESEAEYYRENRKAIPYSKQNMLLIKQRNYIVDNYVEKNNYYRMLNGLPDYNSSPLDYIYVDENVCNMYNIPIDVPLHELDASYISLLSSSGYLDDVIKNNPTKLYLKYIGSNKIDIASARKANAFALIRVPSNISETLLSSFTLIYEQCREYFMTCIYIPEYRQTINYYDNFIGLCIMIMTIQQVLARVIKNTMDRDFFDPYCCKLLFNAYGVPYNSSLDSNTRLRLVQNLNLLVQNKGTSKVVYDIGSILGYSKIELYKYYLMKVRQFDSRGVPMTYYKDIEKTTPDYEKMYDVYFQKVYIDDQDFYSALTDNNNKVSYAEIVEEDPYWIDDEALMKELYESEYNYVESKYMGVSISYRLSQILLKNIYLLRLLIDKKNDMASVTVDLSKMSSNGLVSVFDAVVALCAMTCKQNGLAGEVVTKFTHVLHVMGFSFEKDFTTIRNEILNNPYLDDSLITYFKNQSTYTADRLNELYDSFLSLYDVLLEKMSTTQDINEYQAYRTFYQSIFYTKENRKVFNVGTEENPIYAETYLEYLKLSNGEIYDVIENTNKDDLYTYIEYITAKLTEVVPKLIQSGSSSGSSNTLEEAFMELIRFFKSYTTDIINMNSIYIFDLKPNTMIRLIEWAHLHKDLSMKDEYYLSYSDKLSYEVKMMYMNTLLYVDKIYNILINIAIETGFTLSDKVNSVTIKSVLNEVSMVNKKIYALIDKMNFVHNDMSIGDYFKLVAKFIVFVGFKLKDSNFYEDKVHHIEANINLNDSLNRITDRIISTHNNMTIDDFIKFIENIEISSNLKLDEILNPNDITLVDKYHLISTLKPEDLLKMSDVEKHSSNLYLNGGSTISQSDTIVEIIKGYERLNDGMKFTDKCFISYSD